LVFTDGFSFENNGTDEFMKKASEAFKERAIYVYNLSLDQALKKHLFSTTKKELPLLF
jgi:hypothetical protein